jgi:hypothetical protein
LFLFFKSKSNLVLLLFFSRVVAKLSFCCFMFYFVVQADETQYCCP